MRSRTVHMPFGIFDRPARKAFLFGFATLLLNALPGFAPFDLQGSAFAAQEPIEIGEKIYSRTFGRNIATTASRQIGTPYRLGGQTPGKGFDCSGLVQWVYSQYGISVPRQTTGQQHVGRAVKLSEAMAGDLVVFRSGSAPHGLHTGIMTSHTTFVHAPRTGFNIREESINSYWRPRLISVRRVSDFSLVMNADEAAALIDKRQAVRLPPTPSARTQGHRLSIPAAAASVSNKPLAPTSTLAGTPVQAALPTAPELKSPLQKIPSAVKPAALKRPQAGEPGKNQGATAGLFTRVNPKTGRPAPKANRAASEPSAQKQPRAGEPGKNQGAAAGLFTRVNPKTGKPAPKVKRTAATPPKSAKKPQPGQSAGSKAKSAVKQSAAVQRKAAPAAGKPGQ